MNRRSVPLVVFLAALGLAAGCSTPISTSYDYAPNVDFQSLQTFQWMPIRSNLLNQFELERVTNAVENGLVAKGLQRSANADFLLKVFAGKGRSLGTGYGWSGLETRVYAEGTLVIDMVDPMTNQLIWRGSAKKTLAQDPTPEQQTVNIAAAVAAVLANFPPPGAR